MEKLPASPYGSRKERSETFDKGRLHTYNELYHRLLSYFGDFTQTDLRFSPANKKTGAPSFSIPPGLTCPGQTSICNKLCYAMKGNFNTRSSQMYWGNYLLLLEVGEEVLMRACLYEMVLRALPLQRGYFRLHVSGDFFSQPYLNAWCGVAQMLPRINFWAYTRSFMLDFTHRPKNLVVYASADTDNLQEALDFADFQQMKVAYMTEEAAKMSPYRSFRCPGPGQHNKVESCVSCGLCTNNRGNDVWFAKH